MMRRTEGRSQNPVEGRRNSLIRERLSALRKPGVKDAGIVPVLVYLGVVVGMAVFGIGLNAVGDVFNLPPVDDGANLNALGVVGLVGGGLGGGIATGRLLREP